MCEYEVFMDDVFEEEDIKKINYISKRKFNKPIEDFFTNKKNNVISFVIDDFMMDLMWDIYYILKKTNIARTTKRQVASLEHLESKSVQSMIIGLRWNYYKRQYEIPAYDKKNGDYLFKLIKKLCDYICNKYDLTLDCNTATINKNFRCSLHQDNKNIGSSLTFSLGDFSGGFLDIRNNDEDCTFMGRYDTKFNPIYFDGSKLPHEVTEFEGDRYSVVCYRI